MLEDDVFVFGAANDCHLKFRSLYIECYLPNNGRRYFAILMLRYYVNYERGLPLCIFHNFI